VAERVWLVSILGQGEVEVVMKKIRVLLVSAGALFLLNECGSSGGSNGSNGWGEGNNGGSSAAQVSVSLE
jgi:hypothetical protein